MQPEAKVEEAVVLCGGLGTRLRPVLDDRPKAMAQVSGRPFLEWLLLLLVENGIRRVVLATGYQGSAIQRHFTSCALGVEIAFSQEPEPLGTGGALRLASTHVEASPILTLNGDSYCRWDLGRLRAEHGSTRARATIWLAASADGDRYGAVEVGVDGRVLAFHEKQSGHRGPVSAGVYLIEREVLSTIPTGREVSLERQVFPDLVGHGLFAVAGEAPLVDIGTPESLAAAERQLATELERLEASA